MKFIATVAAATALGMVSTDAAAHKKIHPMDDNSRRIVGGTIAPEGRYPWQAGLSNSAGATTFFCGGSLIAPTVVLSAAHCGRPSYLEVGCFRSSDNCEQKSVSSAVIHPSYNDNTFNNDYSLLFVGSSFTSISPIPYVADASYGSLAAGTDVTVIGWGTTSSGGSLSPQLREVEVDTYSNTACGNAYGSSMITDQMICAGRSGRDSCQGDSGGPLFVNCGLGGDVQVGVVSWGYGCADPNYPGVYSRLSAARSWIDSTLGARGISLATPPSVNNVCGGGGGSPVPAPVPAPAPTGGSWNCPAQYYNSNDGCDCECGIPDPDCDRPNPGILYGCNSGEICVNGVCV